MPTGGPFSDYTVFLKKKIIPKIRFSDLPLRCFFFELENHLDADRLCDVSKAYPFKELSNTLKEIDIESIPSVSFGLPKNKKGKKVLKVCFYSFIDMFCR